MWVNIFYLVILAIATLLMRLLFSKEDNLVKFQSKFFTFYIVSSLFTIVCIPFFILNPKNVNNSMYAAAVLRYITRILGVRWELRGAKNLAEERGAVIVANHQSVIDVLGMFNIWHVMGKVAAIAKKEVFYVWPFGLSAYLAGVVFIDRNNPKYSYKQLAITSELMVNNKTKMWLFPEGTRNKQRGILPFKYGAFKMAIAAGVPVLPVVFSPYYFINRKKYYFGRGNVIIHSLEAVPTVGLTVEDAPKLAEKVRAMMLAAYQDLSKEVLSALPQDYPLQEH